MLIISYRWGKNLCHFILFPKIYPCLCILINVPHFSIFITITFICNKRLIVCILHFTKICCNHNLLSPPKNLIQDRSFYAQSRHELPIWNVIILLGLFCLLNLAHQLLTVCRVCHSDVCIHNLFIKYNTMSWSCRNDREL